MNNKNCVRIDCYKKATKSVLRIDDNSDEVIENEINLDSTHHKFNVCNEHSEELKLIGFREELSFFELEAY